MDVGEQARVRRILEATFDDERLSRGEGAALKEVAEDLAADRSALAFLRNEAFRLAAERVEEAPRAVLAWLARVDRIVDRALEAPAAPASRDKVVFNPGDGCRDLVRGALRGAQRTLDVCVFTITDDRISERILEAYERGVAVRIITDDEKVYDPGSDVGRLRQAGVPIRTDRTPDHMHHKFAIVDGTGLLNGSFNWTRGATDNHENVHWTTAPQVVRAFVRRFDELWAELKPKPR